MTGGVLKIARRIWAVGVAGSPVIGRRRGAFSTLLRQSELRASTGGVLATKSERKMLALACLYSLYAWLLYLSSAEGEPVDSSEQGGQASRRRSEGSARREEGQLDAERRVSGERVHRHDGQDRSAQPV